MSQFVTGAANALNSVKNFDVKQLPRVEELGLAFSFTNAVSVSSRMIKLYKSLPDTALENFPDATLQNISQYAATVTSIWDQMLNFDSTRQNAISERDSLIQQLEAHYIPQFNLFAPLIGFGAATNTDLSRIEVEAKSILTEIKKETDATVSQIKKTEIASQEVLQNIRANSAEMGVSQQAIHFSTEADRHFKLARWWQFATYVLGMILIGLASILIYNHDKPIFAANDAYEAAQLISSKFLIFITIGYLLSLSSRNFLSHKHNEVVNRHRQNALATYKAIADASDNEQSRDVILSHAANCIFAPQESGYIKQSAPNFGEVNLIRQVPSIGSTNVTA
jgi:hypothetical protein